MSVNVKTPEGLVQIAGNGGGGTNPEIETKLEELESLIEQTRILRADLESYGMVKLSNTSTVTDSTGLALPATEKNASIEGTLANKVTSVEGTLANMSSKVTSVEGTLDALEKSSDYSCIIEDAGRYLLEWDKTKRNSFFIIQNTNENKNRLGSVSLTADGTPTNCMIASGTYGVNFSNALQTSGSVTLILKNPVVRLIGLYPFTIKRTGNV